VRIELLHLLLEIGSTFFHIPVAWFLNLARYKTNCQSKFVNSDCSRFTALLSCYYWLIILSEQISYFPAYNFISIFLWSETSKPPHVFIIDKIDIPIRLNYRLGLDYLFCRLYFEPSGIKNQSIYIADFCIDFISCYVVYFCPTFYKFTVHLNKMPITLIYFTSFFHLNHIAERNCIFIWNFLFSVCVIHVPS